MTSQKDLTRFKRQVDIERVLHHYGLLAHMRRTRQGGLRGPCPFHPDTKPSFTTTPAKRGFHCFGCGVKGNVITFVRLKEQIASGDVHLDDGEAAKRLQSWFGIDTVGQHQHPCATANTLPGQHGFSEASDGLTSQASPPNPPIPFTLEPLDQKHPYLMSRSLSPATIKHFGLGLYTSKGSMSGRIVIPIHNTQGQLVAYAGRWPDESPPEGQPTYKLPARFNPSLELFNLHRVPQHARRVILGQDYWSVFHLHQMGFRHVVALMGTSLSEQQRVQLCTRFQRVRIFLGGDEADIERGLTVAMQLAPYIWVRVINYPEIDQPSALTPDQLTHVLR